MKIFSLGSRLCRAVDIRLEVQIGESGTLVV